MDQNEQGQWIATQKADGWRTTIVKDNSGDVMNYNGCKDWTRGNGLYFLSRRGFDKGGPTNIPVSDEIVQIVEAMNLPDKTMLEGEWMARRTIDECPETMFLFDVLWYNDQWIGREDANYRFKMLHELKVDGPVKFPDFARENYQEFYNKQITIPWTEGIVLRHVTSTLIGDTVECKKNPLLIKCKWRRGPDGRETFNV